MRTFRIEETVLYEVQADSKDHALEIIIESNSNERDALCIDVSDRQIWEVGNPTKEAP